MIEDHGTEIAEIQGRDDPSAAARFSFGSIWGLYGVASWIPDPRGVAYNILRRALPGALKREPKLEGRVEWGGSSPGGNVDVVSLTDSKAAALLQAALTAIGHRYRFYRGDSYLRRVFTG